MSGVTGRAHATSHPRALAARRRCSRLARCSRPACGGDDAPSDRAPRTRWPRPRRASTRPPACTSRWPPTSCPTGVDGLLAADGRRHPRPGLRGRPSRSPPAGITADAAVVAVDGMVYAKLPFTTKFVRDRPGRLRRPGPGRPDEPRRRAVLAAHRGRGRRGGRRRSATARWCSPSYTGTVPGDGGRRGHPERRRRARDFDATLHRRRRRPARRGRADRAVLPRRRRRHLHDRRSTDYGTDEGHHRRRDAQPTPRARRRLLLALAAVAVGVRGRRHLRRRAGAAGHDGRRSGSPSTSCSGRRRSSPASCSATSRCCR